MTAVAAVDVGGTAIKAAVVDETGNATGVLREPTPRLDPSGKATVAAIAALIGQLRKQATGIRAAGVALPGIVDARAGRSLYSANLGWRDVDFAGPLARLTGLPLVFAHDVRAGGLAESVVGQVDAGRAAFIAVGTGLSLAVVEDGRIVDDDPWQGEIGQLLAPVPGEPGAWARVEEIASAAAVARRAGQPDGARVAQRLNAGDPAARRAWADAITVLAAAIAWTAAVRGTRTVIIGGGLAESGGALLEPLRAELARLLGPIPPPVLRGAVLGDLAGCIGAGLLAHAMLRRAT